MGAVGGRIERKSSMVRQSSNADSNFLQNTRQSARASGSVGVAPIRTEGAVIAVDNKFERSNFDSYGP